MAEYSQIRAEIHNWSLESDDRVISGVFAFFLSFFPAVPQGRAFRAELPEQSRLPHGGHEIHGFRDQGQSRGAHQRVFQVFEPFEPQIHGKRKEISLFSLKKFDISLE